MNGHTYRGLPLTLPLLLQLASSRATIPTTHIPIIASFVSNHHPIATDRLALKTHWLKILWGASLASLPITLCTTILTGYATINLMQVLPRSAVQNGNPTLHTIPIHVLIVASRANTRLKIRVIYWVEGTTRTMPIDHNLLRPTLNHTPPWPITGISTPAHTNPLRNLLINCTGITPTITISKSIIPTNIHTDLILSCCAYWTHTRLSCPYLPFRTTHTHSVQHI